MVVLHLSLLPKGSPNRVIHGLYFLLKYLHFFKLSDHKSKQKKYKGRDCQTTHYYHAAQIFCDMLGQVCTPELFLNDHSKYQEVTTSFPSNH